MRQVLSTGKSTLSGNLQLFLNAGINPDRMPEVLSLLREWSADCRKAVYRVFSLLFSGEKESGALPTSRVAVYFDNDGYAIPERR